MIKKLILAAALVCGIAHADTVKIVVPYAPGGISDKTARAVEYVLNKHAPQHTYVVEYKPGAGGAVGAAILAKDKSHETTLMVASLGVLINAVLPEATYDMSKDFTHVAYLGSVQLAAITNVNSHVNTVDKLLKTDQPVFFGSSGLNSATHIAGEVLKQNTGRNLVHVPYKGEGAAVNDIVTNNIQLLITAVGVAQTHYGAGRVNVLAVTGTKRNPAMPDVPTFAELGVGGFAVTPNWLTMLANTNADPKIVAQVRAALAEALKSEEDFAHFKQIGLDINRRQLYTASEFIASETVRMKKLLASIKVQ